MHGPEPLDHWTAKLEQSQFKHLKPNGRYVVSESFRDFDGDPHLAGETWVFLTYSFLPYDDGLSLFVSLDDRSEWQIRLQWRLEGQGPIIDDLGRYITAVMT